MTVLEEYYESTIRQLTAKTDEELVALLNREVGNTGWTGTRGAYLAAIHWQLVQRGIDFSAIGDAQKMSLKNPVVLEGKVLKVVEAM